MKKTNKIMIVGIILLLITIALLIILDPNNKHNFKFTSGDNEIIENINRTDSIEVLYSDGKIFNVITDKEHLNDIINILSEVKESEVSVVDKKAEYKIILKDGENIIEEININPFSIDNENVSLEINLYEELISMLNLNEKSKIQGTYIKTNLNENILVVNTDIYKISDSSYDKNLFNDLTSGDVIEVEHDEVNESWPMQTGVYSVILISDGSIETISEDVNNLLIQNNIAIK